VKNVIAETGRKYAVSYSERLSNEAAVNAAARSLKRVIGGVIQVLGSGRTACVPRHVRHGFLKKSSMGAFSAISAAIRSSSFWLIPGAGRRDQRVAYRQL
jgi:hypothetical protein